MAKNRRINKDVAAMNILEEGCKDNMSDVKIQEKIFQECGHKYSTQTIARARKGLGIEKNKPSPIIQEKLLTTPPIGMPEEEKPGWFVGQFKKTHLFKNLQEQFTQIEILSYLEEYGRLCTQFEDIVFSEFFQIDDFLKHRILVNRELIKQKKITYRIDQLSQWIIDNPISEHEEDDTKLVRANNYKFLDSQRESLNASVRQYESLLKARDKISEKLAATRKDRIEELRGGKETFLSVVATIQMSQSERHRQGKFAELTRVATVETKDALRQPIKFPDGDIEPILMDSETKFDE